MKIGISLPVRELQNDLNKIKIFAQKAEELGLTHLRVPEQIIRPGSGPLYEPFTMMAFVAAVTSKIELVPSVISCPPDKQRLWLSKLLRWISCLKDDYDWEWELEKNQWNMKRWGSISKRAVCDARNKYYFYGDCGLKKPYLSMAVGIKFQN